MKMSTMAPDGLSVVNGTVCHRFGAGGSPLCTRCRRIVLICGDEAFWLILAVAPVPSFPRPIVNRNLGKGRPAALYPMTFTYLPVWVDNSKPAGP